jgi:hypothetical protein
VSAKSFIPALVDDVMIYGDKIATQNVKLEISVESQVQVTAENAGASVSPDNNANALVIKGKGLDALSDDPDDLQNELTALAGPSAGPAGGQLPPKSPPVIIGIRIQSA